MSTYILHHSDTDGFGAAFAAWYEFGDEATYIPVNYNEPIPPIPFNSDIYILDFSYPRDILLDMKKKARSITVIDHHKTAQEALKGLDFCIFDMNKSGAVLTWEYFHPDIPVPLILKYVQDFDLWKFDLDYSKEIHLVINSINQSNFVEWSDLRLDLEYDFSIMVHNGKQLLKYQNQILETLCKNAYLTSFDGYNVISLNVTYPFISEVGNRLLKNYPDADFSLTFWVNENNRKVYSLRSIGDFDVSVIAKKYGGGGHKNAAGFTI